MRRANDVRNVIETARLALRELVPDDAEFIRGLLNDPSFLRHIGDKGVRTLDDARKYILDGPVASYERNGFGLYLTELKAGQVPIGICGLVKRDALEDPDIGFAFLPPYWSRGYATESGSAVLGHAQDALGLRRILAITTPDNHASIHVVEKLGLRFERMVRLSAGAEELKLFSTTLPPPAASP